MDLLGEITGGGDYDRLLPHSREMRMFGVAIKVLNLDKLIEVKRAAGRPKDFETIAELEAIREELKGQ
jgi:predicted nucleotidyltransferase